MPPESSQVTSSRVVVRLLPVSTLERREALKSTKRTAARDTVHGIPISVIVSQQGQAKNAGEEIRYRKKKKNNPTPKLEEMAGAAVEPEPD